MKIASAKNANTGSAIPWENGRRECSNRCVRDSVSPCIASAGTVKPSKTPETVACTPDSCTSTHATTATGTSNHQRVRRARTSTANSATATSARPRNPMRRSAV